jgi:hypothetical protein
MAQSKTLLSTQTCHYLTPKSLVQEGTEYSYLPTPAIRGHSESSHQGQGEFLTFDFSSSASKIELLGQGEGGGKILSTGSLGSCFMMPEMYNVQSYDTNTVPCVFSGIQTTPVPDTPLGKHQ